MKQPYLGGTTKQVSSLIVCFFDDRFMTKLGSLARAGNLTLKFYQVNQDVSGFREESVIAVLVVGFFVL